MQTISIVERKILESLRTKALSLDEVGSIAMFNNKELSTIGIESVRKILDKNVQKQANNIRKRKVFYCKKWV